MVPQDTHETCLGKLVSRTFKLHFTVQVASTLGASLDTSIPNIIVTRGLEQRSRSSDNLHALPQMQPNYGGQPNYNQPPPQQNYMPNYGGQPNYNQPPPQNYYNQSPQVQPSYASNYGQQTPLYPQQDNTSNYKPGYYN